MNIYEYKFLVGFLLVFTALFLGLWVSERQRRKALEPLRNSSTEHLETHDYWTVKQCHEAELKILRDAAQERRAVLLDTCLQLNNQRIEVTRLNRALRRRNAALKAVRHNLAFANDHIAGWRKNVVGVNKTILRLCDILPPTEQVDEVRRTSRAMLISIEGEQMIEAAEPTKEPGQATYEKWNIDGLMAEWSILSPAIKQSWSDIEARNDKVAQDRKELDQV